MNNQNVRFNRDDEIIPMLMTFKNISDEDGIILVKMARNAVAEYVTNGNKISETSFNDKFSLALVYLLRLMINLDLEDV